MVQPLTEIVKSEAEGILADVRLEARKAEVECLKALADHLHGIGDADWNTVALRCELTAQRCRNVATAQRIAVQALAKGIPDEVQAPVASFPLAKRQQEV